MSRFEKFTYYLLGVVVLFIVIDGAGKIQKDVEKNGLDFHMPKIVIINW